MALWDSSYNLLNLPRPLLVRRAPLGRLREPKLALPWGSFHQSLASSLGVLLRRPAAPSAFLGGPYFRDCWVQRRIPKRALFAAALWHIVFLLMPYPNFPAVRRNPLAEAETMLVWAGPVRDLPRLELPGGKRKPSPRGEPEKLLPPKGADAIHPRQTIFSDPVHPNHPRQTLINSSAPPEPPKILPAMPNIVQLAPTAQPARPRLEISREALAKLHPKRNAVRRAEDVALPDVPNLEKQVGDLNIAASPVAPPKPKLALNASAAPRVGSRKVEGDAGPAPDLAIGPPSAALPQTLIALSATPAPPAENFPLVSGNLAARISISPDGDHPGAPGGSSNGMLEMNGGAGGAGSLGGSGTAGNREGSGAPGISISGGNPNAIAPVSGLGGAVGINPNGGNATSVALPDRPTPRSAVPGTPHPSAPHDINALKPGVQPEAIFGLKKVYTLQVNMPNLSSATGSWVLNFTELRDDGPPPVPPAASSAGLTGPVPLRKVDPKYPPALIQEKVEGEVVLYAVIRKDGSVDSIQLVRGVEDQLDANAMSALSRWKFKPAERVGEPVELEAIVRIPFRVAASRF